MTDTQYQILSGEAFKYAFSIVKNEADAQDIVQTAMLKLLMREETVESPKYYLLKCVKNGAFEMFRQQKKEVKLGYYALSAPDLVEDSEDIDTITQNRAKELLNTDDFRTYKLYVKYRKITEIAKVRKVAYHIARDAVLRMKQNLKAAINLENGIRNTREILSYREIDNIKLLIKFVEANSNKLHKLKRYFELCDNIIELNMIKALDWGYKRLDEEHLLFIVFLDTSKNLRIVELFFNTTKRRNIKVARMNLYKNPMTPTTLEPHKIKRNKDTLKVQLTDEQINRTLIP